MALRDGHTPASMKEEVERPLFIEKQTKENLSSSFYNTIQCLVLRYDFERMVAV